MQMLVELSVEFEEFFECRLYLRLLRFVPSGFGFAEFRQVLQQVGDLMDRFIRGLVIFLFKRSMQFGLSCGESSDACRPSFGFA